MRRIDHDTPTLIIAIKANPERMTTKRRPLRDVAALGRKVAQSKGGAQAVLLKDEETAERLHFVPTI